MKTEFWMVSTSKHSYKAWVSMLASPWLVGWVLRCPLNSAWSSWGCKRHVYSLGSLFKTQSLCYQIWHWEPYILSAYVCGLMWTNMKSNSKSTVEEPSARLSLYLSEQGSVVPETALRTSGKLLQTKFYSLCRRPTVCKIGRMGSTMMSSTSL